MEPIWDGITQAATLSDNALRIRQAIADAARAYDWSVVLSLLSENGEWINSSRPGGSSLYAPLHQAANGNAPVAVIGRLIEMNAWRTLQNARGERPVDVAVRAGHLQLQKILSPKNKHDVPLGVLLKIQSFFHELILQRAERDVREHALRLPELEPLLEMAEPKLWFAVPGMYGGFNFELVATGVEAKLSSESWSRACEGSGQRHEITSEGTRLVAEGFV